MNTSGHSTHNNANSEINNLEQIATILNTFLASTYVLSVKLKNFHWNVQGPHFNDYHLFFEELYKEIDNINDETAEKIKMIQHSPLASMKEFLQHSFIQENAHSLTAHQMLNNLEKNYSILIDYINKHIRVLKGFNNSYTQIDYLTQKCQLFEKKLWMIRAMSSNA